MFNFKDVSALHSLLTDIHQARRGQAGNELLSAILQRDLQFIAEQARRYSTWLREASRGACHATDAKRSVEAASLPMSLLQGQDLSQSITRSRRGGIHGCIILGQRR
jgi:hypothetical protein